MYQIKEVVLKNKAHEKRRPVIIFHDKTMAIVGEFLMSDVPLLQGEVARQLKDVLNNKVEQKTFIGERCQLWIEKEQTVITDLYKDVAGMLPLSPYTIDTEKLLELTNMWLKRLEQY